MAPTHVLRRPVRRPLAAAVLAPVLLALPACETAPVTGRHQFILFSEDTEMQMGAEAYKQSLDKATVCTDKAVVDQVTRVGKRIADAAIEYDKRIQEKTKKTTKVSEYKWEFTVVQDDKTVNAFCLPGGKVVVYTGILPVCKDDTGLAVVLGHEIAHATARHGGERMTADTAIQYVLQGGEAGLSVALQNKDPSVKEATMKAFGLGAQVGVQLPFSRKQEAEADHIGLIYMSIAGYDPAQAIEFWKRMTAMSGSQPPQFLSDHPAHETRVKNLETWLPEGQAEYEKYPNKGK